MNPPPELTDAETADLLRRIAAHDQEAARVIHARFTPRLVALARHHLGQIFNARTDPESVVQSALGSFFCRYDAGAFAIGSWDDLWGLLAVMTLRKCSNRRRFHRQARRDVSRDVPLNLQDDSNGFDPAHPAAVPLPVELLALQETLADALAGLDADDQRIIELLLGGHTIEETRSLVGCGERTVRRVRDRVRERIRETVDA